MRIFEKSFFSLLIVSITWVSYQLIIVRSSLVFINSRLELEINIRLFLWRLFSIRLRSSLLKSMKDNITFFLKWSQLWVLLHCSIKLLIHLTYSSDKSLNKVFSTGSSLFLNLPVKCLLPKYFLKPLRMLRRSGTFGSIVNSSTYPLNGRPTLLLF